jgi:hypothetical protein
MILSQLQPVIGESGYIALISKFFDESTKITPLKAGATRHLIYKAASGGDEYVIRVEPDSNRAPGVNPVREKVLLALIADKPWSPQLMVNSPEQGVLVMRDAGKSQSEIALNDSQKRALLEAVIEMQSIHGAPQFDYDEIFTQYRARLPEKGSQQAIDNCLALIASLPKLEGALVHHDLHRGNLCWSAKQALTIVDWEYAGLGNPWFDYAVLARDCGFTLNEFKRIPRLQAMDEGKLAHWLAVAIDMVDQLEQIWYHYRDKVEVDMQMDVLLNQIKTNPESVEFAEVMAVIEANYTHTPSAFTNGALENSAEQNQGSAKLLAFAQLQGLSEAETLACFGTYYRNDVLGNPEGSDHGNIRNFMVSGWAGVKLPEGVLTAK